MIEISIAAVIISLIGLYGVIWYVKWTRPLVNPNAQFERILLDLQAQVGNLQSDINKVKLARGFKGVGNE